MTERNEPLFDNIRSDHVTAWTPINDLSFGFRCDISRKEQQQRNHVSLNLLATLENKLIYFELLIQRESSLWKWKMYLAGFIINNIKCNQIINYDKLLFNNKC